MIDWNPRHLYRKLIADEAEMEAFLSEICNQEWNERQDAGRPLAEATAELCRAHPGRRHLIESFYGRWQEMLGDAHADTVAVLADLKERQRPVYALTNWSAETFPLARRRFDFLSWFDGMVVSGEEMVIKPDRQIFERLMTRYGFKPSEAVFIDDSPKNVDAAVRIGLHGIRYTDASRLRRQLTELGLL